MSVVSSAEFSRNLGLYQDKALAEPVTITKNGRERLVLLSVDEYQRLKSQAERDARAPHPERSRSRCLNVEALTKAFREAFKRYAGAVDAAFVYGSFAMGTEVAQSDIDLMVIGDDLRLSDLYTTAQDVGLRLGRKVSPTFLAPDEWRRKSSQKGSFVQKLNDRPKIFIVGSEKDLKAWASKNSTTS
ncbi:type II toxin-antitoxin system prevent-host-death family antitoxin [Bradyrhizobium sp. B097]|uniref:type II toxin-antitoxin system prevent-host-death family antitoxin n=1 Tax=Bradyrhizobium sp. B097 TaxID=3140244 RepID=UPI0031830176